MDGIPEYLASRRPPCFWFGEVLGFGGKSQLLNGRSPLEVVCESAAELGYSVRAVQHCASDGINNARPRMPKVHFHYQHGTRDLCLRAPFETYKLY